MLQTTSVAAPIIPFMLSGHIIKQKRWALVRATVALVPGNSGQKTNFFVWARSTCCAVIPAHDVTRLEITLPLELTTQSELFSTPDISFLLWRTAKQPFSPASSSSCFEIHLPFAQYQRSRYAGTARKLAQIHLL